MKTLKQNYLKWKKIKSIMLCTYIILLTVSCTSDSDENMSQGGNFNYTITGAASKTIKGEDANFGATGSFGQTFINLTIGSDVLDIRIVSDPITAGTFLVNPIVTSENGQIINHPIEEGDCWSDLDIGSTLTNDRRNFSTNSGNRGSITITKVEENILQGNFDMNLRELLSGGDPFIAPTIRLKGTFTAIK